MTYLTHLACSLCGQRYEADELKTLCSDCDRPLLAHYDLEAVRSAWHRHSLAGREPTLWRYREVLPVRDQSKAVKLGEGYTPLLHARRLGQALGLPHL